VFDLPEALGLVDAHTQPGEPYTLVYSRPVSGDPNGELLGALSTRDGLTLVQSLAGMDVYRGERAR